MKNIFYCIAFALFAACNGSLIGLEVRSPKGAKLKTAHLTSKLGFSSFPVVKLVNKELLIAYAGSGTAGDNKNSYARPVLLIN